MERAIHNCRNCRDSRKRFGSQLQLVNDFALIPNPPVKFRLYEIPGTQIEEQYSGFICNLT